MVQPIYTATFVWRRPSISQISSYPFLHPEKKRLDEYVSAFSGGYLLFELLPTWRENVTRKRMSFCSPFFVGGDSKSTNIRLKRTSPASSVSIFSFGTSLETESWLMKSVTYTRHSVMARFKSASIGSVEANACTEVKSIACSFKPTLANAASRLIRIPRGYK